MKSKVSKTLHLMITKEEQEEFKGCTMIRISIEGETAFYEFVKA